MKTNLDAGLTGSTINFLPTPQNSPVINTPQINGIVTTTGLTMPAFALSGTLNASGASITNAYRFTTASNVDSSAAADLVMFAGYDISAGHRALSLGCEEVAVNAAAGASDWYIPIRLNGVTFKLLLHS